jgi:hypothetical protein
LWINLGVKNVRISRDTQRKIDFEIKKLRERQANLRKHQSKNLASSHNEKKSERHHSQEEKSMDFLDRLEKKNQDPPIKKDQLSISNFDFNKAISHTNDAKPRIEPSVRVKSNKFCYSLDKTSNNNVTVYLDNVR